MRLGYRCLVFLALIGVCFYLLMVFTPLSSDDYGDFFLWGTNHRLSNLSDYISNLYLHYSHVSARFVPHVFIELFGIFIGKQVFNVLNAIVFLCFLYLLVAYTSKKSYLPDSRRFSFIVFSTCVIFVLMPGFNTVFLWQSGACNYLWVAVLSLFFLHLMNKDGSGNPIALFTFGLVCGWTNEALTIGICGAWLLLFLIKNDSLTQRRLFLMLGYCLGVLLLIVSPASINRLLGGFGGPVSASEVGNRLLSSLMAMGNIRILPISILLFVFLKSIRKIDWHFICDNQIELYALIITFIFVLITNHSSEHSRFGIEFFSLILTLRMVIILLRGRAQTFNLLCCIILLLVIIPALHFSFLNYKENQSIISQIENNESFIVETNETKIPPLFDRLVVRMYPSEQSDYYAGFIGYPWIDKYYGKTNLCFLPKCFIEDIIQGSVSFSEIDVNSNLPFYVKAVDPDISINQVVMHLSTPDIKSIPFLLRPIRNKMERYSATELKTDRFRVLCLPQGGSFLLVAKNRLVMDRVSSISYQ